MAIATFAVLLLLTVQALRMARVKSYSIDEFDYSQAAWLVAQGEVPYRDFFEHHFPLLYQLLSPVFLATGDDPTAIRWLRLACIPFWLGALLALWRLASERDGPMAGAWAPIFALSTPLFVGFAIEIRPEGLAVGLLLLAVCLLPRNPGSERSRSFAAGVATALAMWASQKALPLGALVGCAFLLRVWHDRRRDREPCGSPVWFLGGGFLIAGAVGLWLSATDSWVDFVRWTFYWSMEHESIGRRFSPWEHLEPWLRSGWWLWLLAGTGLAGATRRLGTGRSERPEALLAVLTGAAFFSYWAQSAPYPYSLVTFAAFLALWAQRGLVDSLSTLRRLGRLRPRTAGALSATLVLVLALGLADSVRTFSRHRPSNEYQHEVLGQLSRLTRPDDPVYANSGSAVARPPTSYWFFTNAHIRVTRAEELTEEIPRRILETGTVAWIFDARTPSLPVDLRAFLESHFVPYHTDLWLWGARYEASGPDEVAQETFYAVRSGRYFVEPASALDTGSLEIDGEPVEDADLTLYAGPHQVRYHGSDTFFLLWLPADGERYRPGLSGPPRFSVLF